MKNRISYLPTCPYWAVDFTRLNVLTARTPVVPKDMLASLVDDSQRRGLPIRRQGNSAIVRVTGPLTKHFSFWSLWFGGTSTRMIQSALRTALADEEVERIVLEVDSPGGEVDGIAELSDAVFAARKEKPIWAVVDGVGASAAYWIASQATQIFMNNRTDAVGSIGVRAVVVDSSKFFESAGIKVIPIDTGEFKSAGVDGVPVTDEQLAEFQKMVDALFDEFVKAVSRGRGMAVKDVRAVADGRMFLAKEAISLGLADKIQSLGDTISGRSGRRRSNAQLALAIAKQKSLESDLQYTGIE